MNKTLTLITGLGVGAVLISLFDGAKRKSRGGSVCERASNVAGDAEDLTGARPPDIRSRAGETDDGTTGGRAASRRDIVKDAVDDYVARWTGAEPDELPPTGSALASARDSASGGRLWDSGDGGSPGATGSVWSLARGILPGAASGWRPVYRSVCRLSFGACLCAAGLRIIRRLFIGRTKKRLADFRRKKFSKKEWVLVTGYAALAFLARLSLLRLRPTALTPDGVYYARLGTHLVSGNFREGLSTFWSPLYPLLTGLSSLVSRDVERGGRLASVLAGSLLVVPVYLLARSLYGEGAASVAALLTAAHPTLAHYSTLLLTESTYTLLFSTALLLGLAALSTFDRGAFFAAGAALGACYLTKPEAIAYAGLILVLTLCVRPSSGSPPSALFSNLLGLAAGFSSLALPYILYLRRATGGWTVSDKLRAHLYSTEGWARRWYGLPEGARTTLADRLYAGVAGEDVAPERRAAFPSDARGLRRLAGRGVEALKSELELLIYYLVPPQLMLLMGLGLFQMEWAKEVYLLLFLASTLAGYALCPDEVSDRLLVPLLPLTLCWAVKGIDVFEDWLVKFLARLKIAEPPLSQRPALLRPLILTALLLSLLPWFAYTLTSTLPDRQLEHRQAGGWVKEHSENSMLIMATAPYTAFYAGGRPMYLPAEEYPVVLEHARRHGVDYLVIDEEVVSRGHWGHNEYAPLRFLLDEHGRHPGLKLVYKFDGVPERKILIYTLA